VGHPHSFDEEMFEVREVHRDFVISIISKIILPKKVFQFIFPTEKFSGNQTWDCILRNPNAKSL
jgi:hypothetical protein